jgi:hypothetical protein
MDNDKEIRADAKLKNLHAEALEELWRFRNPEEGGEKLTLEAIAVEIPLRYGFTVSLSSLSEFYKWLRVQKRMAEAKSLANDFKLELAKDPELSEEDIQRMGQRLFMAESVVDGKAKVFADMVKLKQNNHRLRQNDERIEVDKRKIKLLEDAAADAKAKLQAIANNAKSNGGLTPETLKQIEEAAGLL